MVREMRGNGARDGEGGILLRRWKGECGGQWWEGGGRRRGNRAGQNEMSGTTAGQLEYCAAR